MNISISKYILFLLISIPQILFSQTKELIQSPLMIEQEAGKAVIFKVEWDREFDLEWTSDIATIKFDEQEGEFFWENTADQSGLHQVRFVLKDTLLQVRSQTSTLIKIYEQKSKPKISFKPDSLIHDGFIELRQGQQYTIEFEANIRNAGGEDIVLNYLINNNPSISQFDASKLTIIGNRLIINWEPTQVQADRKYQDLEIIAIDKDNSVGRERFHFKIIDEDLPPVFKYSINPQYSLSTDRQLTIDFSVVDPDGDEYLYASSLPVNIGDVNTSPEGKFSWSVNNTEFSALTELFPLDLEVFVIDKIHSDTVLTKKISIVQTRDNSAPKITRLSNISVKEGYAIKRRIFFRDNNHSADELEFQLDNAPNWLYLEQEGKALYLKSDLKLLIFWNSRAFIV